MIQQQTILKVSDNSGAKTVKCINLLKGFRKKFATVGDVIIVSIQQLRNRSKTTSKVKKGEIYKALIIRTKSKIRMNDHTMTSFNDNAVSLLNKQDNPVATRIMGPLSKKLRNTKHQKLISISPGFA